MDYNKLRKQDLLAITKVYSLTIRTRDKEEVLVRDLKAQDNDIFVNLKVNEKEVELDGEAIDI